MSSEHPNPILSQTDELIRLSFFAEMAKSIASAATLHETLQAVMKQIGDIFAPLNWSLLLRDFKTGDLRFAVVVGSGRDQLEGKVLPRGKGIAGWIAEHKQSVIIEDVRKDSRFFDEMDGLTGFVTRSIIGVPLVSRDKVFGVIELINKLNGEPFTSLDLKILTTIADFAAIAIEKAYYLSSLKRLASTDELTGLPNRRSFLKILEKENQRCRRYHTSYTVLLLDIDDFKKINDMYGHSVGDAVLRKMAQILQEQIRAVDVPCRYGGDEFLVLMPNTSLAAGEEVKKRIPQALASISEPGIPPFTVSIGVSEGNETNFNEILKRLDVDMYRDKITKPDPIYTNLTENLQTLIDEE
jgi:diguanylate cyclase (GGDEF)-like protein